MNVTDAKRAYFLGLCGLLKKYGEFAESDVIKYDTEAEFSVIILFAGVQLELLVKSCEAVAAPNASVELIQASISSNAGLVEELAEFIKNPVPTGHDR